MGRWTRQPPPGTPLDWSHPSTVGLAFAANIATELPLDGVTGAAYTYSTSSATNKPYYGVGLSGFGFRPSAYQGITRTATNYGGKTTEVGVLVTIRDVLAAGGNQTLSSYSPNPVLVGFGNVSGVLYGYGGYNYPSGHTFTGSIPLTLGNLYFLSCMSDQTTSTTQLFINGAPDVSIASAYGGTSAKTFIAADSGYGGATRNSVVHAAFLWQRILGSGERLAIAQNPWQLFAPLRTRRFYSIPVGSVWNVSLSESGSAADALSAIATFAASIAEAGSAADTVSIAGAAIAASLSETGSAADSLSAVATLLRALSEAGTAADSLSAALNGAASIAETGAVADAVTAALNAVVSLSEAGNAADTLSWSGQVYSVSLAESGAAADTVSAAELAVATLASTANAVDTLSALAAFTAALGEAGNAVDTLHAAGSFTVVITDAGNAVDVINWLQGGETQGAERIVMLPYGRRILVVGYGRRIAAAPHERTLDAASHDPRIVVEPQDRKLN